MTARKTTILLADNDPPFLRLFSYILQIEGYEVIAVQNGEQAIEQIQVQQPDLVLLDLLMPKVDGLTACERIRVFSAVPIIILTAWGAKQERVRGFDVGVDEYLNKPFNIDELLARLRAILRRSQPLAHQSPESWRMLRIGDLTIDDATHEVTRAEQPLALSPMEYRLLACLARHAGDVLPCDYLLSVVWGEGYRSKKHLLQANIHRLRGKLETNPSDPAYIVTEIGVGYSFAAR